jgi:hypothetical protein
MSIAMPCAIDSRESQHTPSMPPAHPAPVRNHCMWLGSQATRTSIWSRSDTDCSIAGGPRTAAALAASPGLCLHMPASHLPVLWPRRHRCWLQGTTAAAAVALWL